MSNSPLIVYTKLSPHKSHRKNGIDTITIHHMAGNLSIERCGEVFQVREASANYGVGTDGRIAMYVEEKHRAWTSSNAANDHRAVTIEVANCGGDPDWKVSDKALEVTIDLCVDICQRNGIKRLNFTGDKTGNLTMHKWFAATACPGPYLESKFPYIAQEVNRRMEATSAPQGEEIIYRVQVGAFAEKANAERQLDKVKALGYNDAFIAVVDGKLYRVQIGAFREKANAERLAAEVKALGLSAIVTRLSGQPLQQTKTVDELAQEVIEGKHGSGLYRKQSLGAMYEAVQKRVNELLMD